MSGLIGLPGSARFRCLLAFSLDGGSGRWRQLPLHYCAARRDMSEGATQACDAIYEYEDDDSFISPQSSKYLKFSRMQDTLGVGGHATNAVANFQTPRAYNISLYGRSCRYRQVAFWFRKIYRHCHIATCHAPRGEGRRSALPDSLWWRVSFQTTRCYCATRSLMPWISIFYFSNSVRHFIRYFSRWNYCCVSRFDDGRYMLPYFMGICRRKMTAIIITFSPFDFFALFMMMAWGCKSMPWWLNKWASASFILLTHALRHDADARKRALRCLPPDIDLVPFEFYCHETYWRYASTLLHFYYFT